MWGGKNKQNTTCVHCLTASRNQIKRPRHSRKSFGNWEQEFLGDERKRDESHWSEHIDEAVRDAEDGWPYYEDD